MATITYRPHVIKQPNGRFAIFHPATCSILPDHPRENILLQLTLSSDAEKAAEWMKEADDDAPTDWSCATGPVGYRRWEGAISRFKDRYGRSEHDKVCAIGFDRRAR